MLILEQCIHCQREKITNNQSTTIYMHEISACLSSSGIFPNSKNSRQALGQIRGQGIQDLLTPYSRSLVWKQQRLWPSNENHLLWPWLEAEGEQTELNWLFQRPSSMRIKCINLLLKRREPCHPLET